MRRLVHQFWALATARPRLSSLFLQSLIFTCAGICAFLLRFDFRIPDYYRPHLYMAIPVWLVVKLAVFHVAGLDRRWWRFFSLPDTVSLAVANTSGSIITGVLFLAFGPAGFPRSIPIIDFLLCLTVTALAFLGRRALNEVNGSRPAAGRKVVLYGAGRAGVALAAEMKANPSLELRPVGFVDDNPALRDMMVMGLRVYGPGTSLAAVVKATRAKEVLITAPSATAEQMLGILECCHAAGIRFRTMATLSEIVEGKALASQIRDVDVQDLLCRSAVHLDHELIRQHVEDHTIMITGAAGSIGSELCRQLARFRPAAIVGLDTAETGLFHIEREIRASFPDVTFLPEIGSIRDRHRLDEVLATHSPSVIFHAAAYKHVPMMERSLFEAVSNNVFGTQNLAEAADDAGVDHFILISSDKAVRPTSVMGATKRLCELLLLARPHRHTRFSAVRFGNVLGSNGSVIRLFKEQIAAGGPVTITHPEMRRYFMTIPEAAQLVIQAWANGVGGEIFVLDMGEQLKIVDLARNLILLSGLRPDIDVRIRFTGTRPGEKLYEELNLAGEETAPTRHPKIKIFTGAPTSGLDLAEQIDALREACLSLDGRRVILILKDLIPEYNPSTYILRQVLESPAAAGTETVIAGAASRQQKVRSLARSA